MNTIGFLELSSIAKGIESADAMLKAAQVELAFARAVCPGKFNVMVTGEVAAVSAAVEAGQRAAADSVVDSVVIARLHEQVIPAMYQCVPPTDCGAVGVMEFFSITAAVYAADAAVKAADVTLLDVRLGTGIGGKSFVVLTGEVAAVSEAVRCGAAKGGEAGQMVEAVVIPSPRPEIFEALY